MAIFSMHCKVIGRGQKKSDGTASLRTVVAAAAYRAGEQLRNLVDGVLYDFSKKQGVIHTEILLPQGAPSRYHDRQTLWNEVEAMERRCDAQFCRELVIALPAELSHEDNIKLARKFVQRQFVDHGMCADVSFHDPDPKSGQRNPHAHIMLTMRDLQAGRFGSKNRSWNKKELLQDWRELWAVTCNGYLAECGISASIDHRSYKERGIDKAPTVHVGVKATALERRGLRTAKGNINRSIRAHNAARECGVETPTILEAIGKLWQQAAEQRRGLKTTYGTVGTPDRSATENEDSHSGVQRRTYTLHSNVVRQGSDPAPENGAATTPNGSVAEEKRPPLRGQKTERTGEALRQPASRGNAVYNIKVMSSAISFMSQHGVGSYAELESKLSNCVAAVALAEGSLAEANRYMGIARAGIKSQAELEPLRVKLQRAEQVYGAALRCQANRAEEEQYSKTIFKENYYKRFGHKIDAYQRAAELLRAAGFSEHTAPEQLRQSVESLRTELKKQTGKYQWTLGKLAAAGFDISTIEELHKAVDQLDIQGRERWSEQQSARQELGHWQRIKQQVDNVLEGRDAKTPTKRVTDKKKDTPDR